MLVAARLWAGGVRAEYLPTDTLVMAGAGRERGLEGVNEACSSAGIPFVVVVRPHTLVAKKAVKVPNIYFMCMWYGDMLDVVSTGRRLSVSQIADVKSFMLKSHSVVSWTFRTLIAVRMKAIEGIASLSDRSFTRGVGDCPYFDRLGCWIVAHVCMDVFLVDTLPYCCGFCLFVIVDVARVLLNIGLRCCG